MLFVQYYDSKVGLLVALIRLKIEKKCIKRNKKPIRLVLMYSDL
jgi:hypothetical protein